MLNYLVLAFLISFLLCILIIRTSKKKKFLITDELHLGPQTFHQKPTPRLGGVALFLAFFLMCILAFLRKEYYRYDLFFIFISSIFAFLSGLLEDLTGKLNPKIRLLIVAISGALVFYIADVKVVRLDIPYIDNLFNYMYFSLIFTVFALTGLANAINIIDGFNGLASMVSITILLAITMISYRLGDYFIATSSLGFAGALVGFFLLNYPYGLIFLGDSGAYLTGFFIACMSVLIVKRHLEVSAWFALLVNIYPIYETLFSIYRRKFLKGYSAFTPDDLHLHTLVYKFIVKKILGEENPIYHNPATSPLLWFFNLFGVIPAILFWDNTLILIVFSLVFMICYSIIYWKIIKSGSSYIS